MMDVGGWMRRNSAPRRHGDKGETQKARVAGARPKERRAGQRDKRRDKPDPVAELTQEHVGRLAIAGVSLGVVMRAKFGAQSTRTGLRSASSVEGAERRLPDPLPSSESARPSRRTIKPTSSASMTTIPAAANIQRRNTNIA